MRPFSDPGIIPGRMLLVSLAGDTIPFMTHEHIASIRLTSQQLAGTPHPTAAALVSCMGALQAQDYAMSKWAVGMRLPGSTDSSVEAALNAGSILRTHVLRPTWHLVSAEDIYWMLELTGPHVKRIMQSSNKRLGLSEDVFKHSQRIMEDVLRGQHLTREELMAEMVKQDIAIEPLRAVHLMMRAELDGLVCSGAVKGKQQTYALLSERVPNRTVFSRERAIEELARRYFTSHAPATLQDFTWWSGLPVADARAGLESMQRECMTELIDGHTYYFAPALLQNDHSQPSAHLFPAFDEFLISYKTRHVTIAAGHQAHAFTSNGIFRPTIAVNGETVGTWKRTIQKDTVVIEPSFFSKPDARLLRLVARAAEPYGTFLEKKVLLKV